MGLTIKGKKGGGLWLFEDLNGLIWEITKQRIENYEYWLGETINRKHCIRADKRIELIHLIIKKHGKNENFSKKQQRNQNPSYLSV